MLLPLLMNLGMFNEPTLSYGNWGKKKKKGRVIRWSDYATEEARAQALAEALAVAAVPMAQVSIEGDSDEEYEIDDRLLLAALKTVIH